MLKTVDFYYFSPTGGTQKSGALLSGAMAEQVTLHNLTDPNFIAGETDAEVAVIAAPVFGGRIPAIAAEKIRSICGKGKKAVTLAVYGVRAYEDALLELNDTVQSCGFTILASGAFNAQHSVVPEVGEGRPDAQDAADLKAFAKKILEKLEGDEANEVEVPGNRPYKPDFTASATPITLGTCKLCGKCAAICPSGAITIADGGLVTDANKCSLCMACVVACPAEARILPPPMQEAMNKMLGALKDVRRENEIYL